MVAVKAAGTFSLALEPKIMPAGFIKKRFEFPCVTWIKPLITETSPPTIRPKIFWISGLDTKLAVCPELSPNCSKLWKRLAPERVPPVMSKRFPSGVTTVLVPSELNSGVMGCAWVFPEVNTGRTNVSNQLKCFRDSFITRSFKSSDIELQQMSIYPGWLNLLQKLVFAMSL